MVSKLALRSARFAALARMGCVACLLDRAGWRAPHIHHLRDGQGMSQRADDMETIPLCPEHHQGDGSRVPSVHGTPADFVDAYGTERELLAWVNARLEGNA